MIYSAWILSAECLNRIKHKNLIQCPFKVEVSTFVLIMSF